MITITNIARADENADLNLAIMRSFHGAPWIRQETLLAPSGPLFQKYLALRNADRWNPITFNTEYVPQFLRELRQNQAALQLCMDILKMDAAGKHIVLMCSCSNEELCHRSIIAGLLYGAGGDVHTDTGKTYRYYYDRWLRLTDKFFAENSLRA